jgi:transcription elongation factor GreA
MWHRANLGRDSVPSQLTNSCFCVTIHFLVESASNHNPTLAELAAGFLLSLPSEGREKTQAEVYKFIRWLGLHRKIKDIGPLDVASYAEQVTPAAAKPVKSFLTYIRKRGLTEVNLATHLRAKKAAPKVVALRQSSQGQTTLTAQGYAKLEAELTSLKNQRSHVIEELRRAAADKDFRENAPLNAAREQKAHLEGKIEELESTLKLARIMDENQGTSRIKIGNTVVLRDLSSSKELSYALVDPSEANPAKGKISIASPLGKVLLDKERGQTVEVTAPGGISKYYIKDIQHD